MSHESCAGLLALKPYLSFLSGSPATAFDRSTVVEAFANAENMEKPLTDRLLGFLATKPAVRIVGPAQRGPGRVATISFLHQRLTPAEIVAEVDRHQIGMRHGNFYSWRLMERLGIPPEQGVARVSLVHYNTIEEVDRLIAVLDDLL